MSEATYKYIIERSEIIYLLSQVLRSETWRIIIFILIIFTTVNFTVGGTVNFTYLATLGTVNFT